MRWLLPVVLVAMIATAAGALAVRDVYGGPGQSAAIMPSQEPVPPSEQPGDPTVMGTKDAGDHPLYEPIRQSLQTYFDAINGKRYDSWLTVVTADRAARLLEPKWQDDYRTTRDGSIIVRRIEMGPEGSARVLLTFTSVQDPEDAPAERPEPCLRWRGVWPFVDDDGTWKLDVGSTSEHDKC